MYSLCFYCIKHLLVRHTYNLTCYRHFTRRLSSIAQRKDNFTILGIETSCDDTGCAIVNNNGRILGEALHSQKLVHLRNGGIIPPVAQDLHRSNIESVVSSAFKEAGMTGFDVDAIAVTVKPGLLLSLVIGMKYAKHLSRKFSKPLIPIHHMEAHALTARMEHNVEFPFLVLLISGGHCLLSVVKAVDDFLLLGKSLDDAPGEAFDKMARRLKLKNLEQFSKLSGGEAIELAASLAENKNEIVFPIAMLQHRDCNFSFTGLKSSFFYKILQLEKERRIKGDGILPEVYDLCAEFQRSVTRHLCQRTQRAMEYIELKNMLPKDRMTLVVSGGVASNSFIEKALNVLCKEMGYRFVKPRTKLCTDNGVMIAWNGVEKWNKGIGATFDLNSVDIQSRCELGTSIREDVLLSAIKCKWVKSGILFASSGKLL